MTPEHLEARRQLLWAVLGYGAIALGPIIIVLIIGTMIWGTAPLSGSQKLSLMPIFVWGFYWVSMMLNCVRLHPLPKNAQDR